MHRAGDIKEGKSRDVLFLDFVAYPFDDPGTYIGVKELLNDGIVKKIAKPKGIKNLIKLYKFCSKK